jgi:hypothetical protein
MQGKVISFNRSHFETELYHPVYVDYFLFMYEYLQKNLDLSTDNSALYIGSGSDLAGFMLTTNSKNSLFIDSQYSNTLHMFSTYLSYLQNNDPVESSWRRVYMEYKYDMGFTPSLLYQFSPMNTDDLLSLALITELEHLGVDLDNIQFKYQKPQSLLQFEWKHPSLNYSDTYSITFSSLSVDHTDVFQKELDLAKISNLVLFYQRASDTLLLDTQKFIPVVVSLLEKQSALLIDPTCCTSETYLDRTHELETLLGPRTMLPEKYSSISKKILTLRAESLDNEELQLHGELMLRYGWDQLIFGQ